MIKPVPDPLADLSDSLDYCLGKLLGGGIAPQVSGPHLGTEKNYKFVIYIFNLVFSYHYMFSTDNFSHS